MRSSELQERRAAEYGYETVGKREIQMREALSIFEPNDPATPWLEKFDTAAPATKEQLDPVLCTQCSASFVPQRIAAQRFCTKKCAKRWQEAHRSKEYLDRRRVRHTKYMREWNAKNRASVAKTQNKRLADQRAERRALAAAAVYTCLDCGDRWRHKSSMVINPPPLRCSGCAKNWGMYQARVQRAKRRVAKKIGLQPQPIPIFRAGDLVKWTSLFSRTPLSKRKVKHGTILLALPAKSCPREALRAIGFKFKIENLEFGNHNKGARAASINRDSYLVAVGDKVYRPSVKDLQLDAPAPAVSRVIPLNAAGTVKVRKRMAA